MQAIQSFFAGTAPDVEPTQQQQQQQRQQQQQQQQGGGLLSDWNAYASGEAGAAPTDRLLASAEEGAAQGERGVCDERGAWSEEGDATTAGRAAPRGRRNLVPFLGSVWRCGGRAVVRLSLPPAHQRLAPHNLSPLLLLLPPRAVKNFVTGAMGLVSSGVAAAATQAQNTVNT